MSFLRALAIFFFVALFLGTNDASAQTGQQVYSTWCSGCHNANPTTDPEKGQPSGGVKSGANRPDLITGAIIYPTWFTPRPNPMYDNLYNVYNSGMITDADISNIATYLGTVFGGGGGGGQLSMPTPSSFGSQTVGTQSAGQTLTITNVGGASATINSFGNTNAAEFIKTGGTCTTPKTLGAGASCTVIYAFQPSATGARSATITVNNTGSPAAPTFGLSGTGQSGGSPGQLSMPGALNFGTQTVGTQSSLQTATVTNVGGQTVTITSVVSSNSGEFPIVSSTCSGAIGAGASCQVNMRFQPTATGARSTTVTVTSTGTGSPQSFSASGTGSGGATGQLSIPSTLTLPTTNVGTTSVATTLTVTNVGAASVTVSGVTNSNAGEFPIMGNSCTGAVVVPGASCTVSVSFTPAAAGARASTLQILSNGTGNPQSVAASGTGASAGSVQAAIEYYYPAWDHYFITAVPQEITDLDGGKYPGWVRTGLQVNIYPLTGAPAGSAYVCRFFSVSFAPRSSHYYSGEPGCTQLMTNPDWQFEAQVFNLQPSPTGTCPAGTIPVYRLYNQGAGGAPNHRYTTNAAVRDQMVAAGYAAEGNGPNVVWMCGPP
jgi:hypothetical protein